MAEDMMEHGGGNAGVVDALVARWNEQNVPQINLTYIPHTEMVPDRASDRQQQVPDLMGMDRSMAAVRAAGQLVEITDKVRTARTEDGEPATWRSRP